MICDTEWQIRKMFNFYNIDCVIILIEQIIWIYHPIQWNKVSNIVKNLSYTV